MASAQDYDYDYESAGFDSFLTRSIDSQSGNLTLASSEDIGYSRQVNYDQNQVTGSLGDTLQIGNIQINGVEGRISIFDGDQNEVVRIGSL